MNKLDKIQYIRKLEQEKDELEQKKTNVRQSN